MEKICAKVTIMYICKNYFSYEVCIHTIPSMKRDIDRKLSDSIVGHETGHDLLWFSKDNFGRNQSGLGPIETENEYVA